MPPSGDAASKLQIPANILMIVAGLSVGMTILFLIAPTFFSGILGTMRYHSRMPFEPGMYTNFHGALGFIRGIFSLAIAGVIFYGAMQMKKLESYAWALTAAILSILPCIGPCCCIGIPVGIWALVLLLSADVKAAFR